MKKNILLSCFVIGIIGFSSQARLLGQEQPNIILFLIDDADKYQFGCYGGSVYTPHIDQLAEEGMMFHQAYVNSTVCTPSRYSLTTGRYAGRSAYNDYLDDYPVGSQGHPEFNVGLEQDHMNIGHLLQSVGYKTGWVGKYHLHADETLEGGLTQEEADYLKNTAGPDDARATELFQREERAYREYIKNKGFSWAKNIYEGNLKDPYKEHNLEWTIEAALEFIDSAGNAPFYLHFNTTLLHGPDNEWEGSMAYPTYSGEGLVSGEFDVGMPPRSTVIDRIESNGFNLIDNPAGITWLDDGVGAVMNKLESLGIAENTMLVFLPDHGSDNKASLYNTHGANIPMIIRYPGEINSGSECSSLVQGIDLIPTFYEYAGVELPEGYQMDGKSLRPIFEDPASRIHESIYMELGCARAVITEEYKYIAKRYTEDRINTILKMPEAEFKDRLLRKLIYLDGHIGISERGIRYNPEYLSPDQLYDVQSDYTEQNNLARDNAYEHTLEEMKALLITYLESFPNRPFGELVPGLNATAPHPTVEEYIKNIQDAIKNGATIKQGVISCDGNCITENVFADVDERKREMVQVFQENNAIRISSPEIDCEMKLYDIWGRALASHAIDKESELCLSKESFEPGTYFFTFHSGQEGYFGHRILRIN